MKEYRVIIPAAGKGSRLQTEKEERKIPKALRMLHGRPLLDIVLENTNFIPRENTYIIIGYEGQQIRDAFGPDYHYVEQTEQLGTGHAVKMCADAFADFDGIVLVTFGDMPMFRRDVMRAMCEKAERENADCVLLTAENPALTLWARVIRENGKFKDIVEGKDCTPEEARTKELFAGVLAFQSRSLFSLLPLLDNNNVQHEYYLTEVPRLMAERGMKVETVMTDDPDDLCGVNTQEDLRRCEEIYEKRQHAGGNEE